MQMASTMHYTLAQVLEQADAHIRVPKLEDIDTIIGLFETEVWAGKMLPRSADEIASRIADWLVIVQHKQIAGCVSLVFFNDELCEVRSLAVDPAFRGQGFGHALVEAAIELARQRGMSRVLTLTRATKLFEQVGFEREIVTNFPEKVWRDCAPCPLRERCDEVALIFHLEEAK